jgi:secernin
LCKADANQALRTNLAAVCDTVVVVQDGRVFFAKNSDRDPNESQVLEWHGARSSAEGARLRCTWTTIPQARETHPILISRPSWMWGAEMGVNSCGVAIGNEAVFTNQPYADDGLTGMDLLRLALERASSASEAVDVIVHLLERYGQGGGCGYQDRSFTYHNSFLIADSAGAFVLETAGSHWEMEPVDAGVRTISNGLTIPGFAERYGNRLRSGVNQCRVRRALTTARARPDPAALMKLLRSHGASRWPTYSPVNGAMSGPCMHAGGLVASAQTTASWVSELGPDGATHWATGTAAPCVSLFKPVSIDEPVDLGGDALWWRHERLHRMALRDPTRVRFLDERDRLEQQWLASPPSSAEAFQASVELLERWSAELGRVPDGRPWWVRRHWQEREREAQAPNQAQAA